MGYKGGGEGGHRFERIRLDSGPGNTVTVVCIEKGDVWRGLESIIHRAFYTPFLLSLSPSLSLNHSPSLALYTISPFHLQGPVKLSCKFNSMQSFSFRFSRRRSVPPERKGKVAANQQHSHSHHRQQQQTDLMHPHCGYDSRIIDDAA